MKRLWLLFTGVLVVSFSVLGWIGSRIYQEAPPIADKVVTTAGVTVVDAREIQTGQNVWQTLGGMEVGSIWGHGSYVAPDWTADWLHREAVFILNRWSNDEFQADFEALGAEQSTLMQNLRWMRVPGDTIFFLGAVALVVFVAGLKTGHSFRRSD